MYIKMFEAWENTENSVNPNLRKTLNAMKEGFKNDEEIALAIEKFGFEREKTGLERTADYRFIDNSNPRDPKTYISYDTGYIRVNSKSGSPFTVPRDKQGNVKRDAAGNVIPGVAKGPITKAILMSLTDRLCFILRRAMKQAGVYNEWLKSNKKRGTTVPEFFETHSGYLSGQKYGI
jgi:hypothetical protein